MMEYKIAIEKKPLDKDRIIVKLKRIGDTGNTDLRFLLDTGSEISIMHDDILYDDTFNLLGNKMSVIGITGDKNEGHYVSVQFKAGGKRKKTVWIDFLAIDFANVRMVMSQKGFGDVAGILGMDFINDHGAVIDINNRLVTIKD